MDAKPKSLRQRLALGEDVHLKRWKVAGYALVPVLIECEAGGETEEEAVAEVREKLFTDPASLIEMKGVQPGQLQEVFNARAIALPERKLVNHRCMPLDAPKFVCAHCGNLFPFVQKTTGRPVRWCSDTCRVYAMRLRKRAEKAADL